MQRLTTAPPWRHAPRFFLSAAPVANPGADRGVSGYNGFFPPVDGASPPPGGAVHRWMTANDAP
ncbi:hypothetical protein EAO69_09790 [Streptomyces sp. me109]|nr:hypothetical protein EAO69_09790 [Streptomyces sp. me109]